MVCCVAPPNVEVEEAAKEQAVQKEAAKEETEEEDDKPEIDDVLCTGHIEFKLSPDQLSKVEATHPVGVEEEEVAKEAEEVKPKEPKE